jgi:hypothetical protein
MTRTQSLSLLFAGYLLASFGNAVSGVLGWRIRDVR